MRFHPFAFLLATIIGALSAAVAQTPSADQLSILKNIPADQQQQLLQGVLGGKNTGTTRTDPSLQTPETVRQRDQRLDQYDKFIKDKTVDGRPLRLQDEDPELRPGDTVLIDLIMIEHRRRPIVQDPTTSASGAGTSALTGQNPNLRFNSNNTNNTNNADPSQKDRKDKSNESDPDRTFGRSPYEDKPLTDSEIQRIEDFRQRILKNNPYTLNRFGVLDIPGLPSIPLAGLTASEATGRLSADPDLRARLKGRYLGWGSGGPARLELLRTVRGKDVPERGGASGPGGKVSLTILERRDPPSYSRGYSGFLNPLYEPGMSHLQIAERWLAAEARRRPNFKQQLQNLEHGAELGQKAWVETEIESILKRTGNPWGIPVEDVEKDLYVTNFTRMDGFQRMVWTTAHFDRNHWNPEEPMKSVEVFVANEYRAKNPNAQIRLINWDPPMTHYGHLELPRQLAAAHFSVVRWLVRP